MSVSLVTGGAGFIGSHVVRRLLKMGKKVRVLDNFSTGHLRNIEEVLAAIELVKGDLRNLDDCKKATAGAEVVYHLGAQGSVPRSIDNPILSNECNVTGTANILVAARDAGIKRFVYSASSSAYGASLELPKRETQLPQPISPYAVSKLAGEHYCLAFAHCYAMETVSLRYFNVYGPRQDPKSQYAAAIPAFVTALLAGTPPTVYGDGETSRDFCFVDNVVDANILGGTTTKPLKGESVNIACGERTSLNQVIQIVNDFLGTKIKPNYAPPRAGDPRHTQADLSEAKRVIGYEPKVLFAEGLRRTIPWYQEQAN